MPPSPDLGHRIGSVPRWHPLVTLDDRLTICPLRLFAHAGEYRLDQMKRTAQVDAQDAVPLLARACRPASRPADASGIVHQHVDHAACVDHRLDQRPAPGSALRLRARRGFAARCFDLLPRLGARSRAPGKTAPRDARPPPALQRIARPMPLEAARNDGDCCPLGLMAASRCPTTPSCRKHIAAAQTRPCDARAPAAML